MPILTALLLATAPLAPRDLVEMVDLSGLAASPDGRWVAFRIERPSVAKNRVALSWAVVPSDGSAPPKIVADGGVGLANGAGVLPDERPIWRADGSGFAVRARIGGVTALWLVARDGAPARRLTPPDTEVVGFETAPDGRALVARIGPGPEAIAAREQALRDGGVRLDASVDLSIGAVGGADTGDGPQSVRMTGDWFTRAPLVGATHVEIVVEAAKGEPPWARSDRPTLSTAAACRLIGCGSATVAAVVPVPGRTAWIVTRTDRALDQALFVIAGSRARRITGGQGLLSGSRDEGSPCAVTAEALFCVAAAASAPPRLLRIALSDGTRKTVYAPNAALAARLPGRTTRLRWQDPQGRGFNGVLVQPAGARGPVGLVLQYYRCAGFLRGGVGDELPFQLLAADGIASLCINRAPPDARADRVAEYRVALTAIETVVAQLDRQQVVDPRQIGMQGLSFGSEVTMWVARRSRLLRAAAIATGQIEPSTYWFGNMPGRNVPEELRVVYGLGPPTTPTDRWRDLSPASDSGAIWPPLLMQLPEPEARWSVELATRLARAGHAVDTFVFPDAAHIKFLPRQKEAAYARNRAWFRLWLDPATLGETDQKLFARWQAAVMQRDGGR